MSILLIGVNHKTAPVEIRERLAFNDEACANGLRQLVDGEVVREGLIVSTCNRVEILSATASDQLEFGAERITQFLDTSGHLPVFSTSISITTLMKKPCDTCFASLLHSIRWSSANRRCWARCVMHTRSASKAGTAGRVLNRLVHHTFASPNESETRRESPPAPCRSVTWQSSSARRSSTRSKAAP